MHRTALYTLCMVLLAGCGGEIARIEGLPQTRDVAGVDWPRLVDTPAAPVNTLLPETGARTLVALSDTRDSVLTRAAQPGTPRISAAELDNRVERIRRQANIDTPAVDPAELAARAARLTALREQPDTTVDAAALAARAARIAAARGQAPDDVDEAGLRARVDRIAAQTQYSYGNLDRSELSQRSQRIAAITAQPAEATLDLPARRAPRVSPLPPSKPLVARRPDLDKPVIPDDFRKRAQEALKRARERAAQQ